MKINRSAEMLKYVENYYRESKYYLAQNNAKGKEFDIIHTIIEDLPNQFNPQTATWGLKLWEELLDINSIGNIEERRTNILMKTATLQVITPISLERLIKKIFNIDTKIIRNFSPYTFLVEFKYEDDKEINLKIIRQLIEDYKEAHMAYNLLGDYDTKFKIDIKILLNNLQIKNEFYPRLNIPYLKYDGIAKYDSSVRYDKYKSNERIELYPIQLKMKSEVKPQIIFLSEIQMKNIFKTPIYTETKLIYKKDIPTQSKFETKLKIKKETVIMPKYKINLKIGKHLTKYNSAARYDGTKQYYMENEEII